MPELMIALAFNGLVWGLIVALIALGLSVIFGLLDVINVAHGDFFMVGTVLGLVISTTTGFWIALVLVPALGFLLGWLVERTVIRPSKGSAALTIVTTFERPDQDFGNNIGMYGVAIGISKGELGLWSALALGTAGATLMASIAGAFAVRLNWHYFAIITVIFSLIIYFFAMSAKGLTGGDDGINFAPQ